MTRLPIIAATAVALALAACAPRPAPAPAPAPRAGRAAATAPVSFSAALAAGTGRVGVTFDADAHDVRIEVFGAGGLAVTTDPVPVDGARFARGETATLDVAFDPGPGRSSLVVAVTGAFARGGARRAAVANFDVGEPTREQRQGAGAVVELPGGERLHVVGSGK